MSKVSGVNVSLLNKLVISLMFYSVVVFVVVVIFSGRVFEPASGLSDWLAKYLGILLFISNKSQFSDIAQIMFVFNLFVIFLVFFIINFSGAARVSVKGRGVWKHLFASLFMLIILVGSVYFDTSSSECSTRGCRFYEKVFNTEILFSIYLSGFALIFALAASRFVFCLSKILFNKKLEEV